MSRGTSSRERILAAGTSLFVRNGYHGTGIQELSDAVGMGRGALYHHIGSKEELLFEISLSLLGPVTAEARVIASSAGEPKVKLRELARALLVYHEEHGDAWSVLVREARLLTPQHYAEINVARDEYEAVWANLFAEGASAGAWRPVDDIEIRGILGMLNSAARWMRPDGDLSPLEIADHYVDLLFDGLLQ